MSNFGVFAELQDSMAEGMIRMEKLGNDYFVYDEERQILYGERTGVTYRLGDEITVQIDFVDITRLEIDLILMGVTPRKSGRKKGKSALFRAIHNKASRYSRKTAEKSSEKPSGRSRKSSSQKSSKEQQKRTAKDRHTKTRKK